MVRSLVALSVGAEGDRERLSELRIVEVGAKGAGGGATLALVRIPEPGGLLPFCVRVAEREAAGPLLHP